MRPEEFNIIPQKILLELLNEDMQTLENFEDKEWVYLEYLISEGRLDEDNDVEYWQEAIEKADEYGLSFCEVEIFDEDELDDAWTERLEQTIVELYFHNIPSHARNYINLDDWVADWKIDSTPERDLNEDNEFFETTINGNTYYLMEK